MLIGTTTLRKSTESETELLAGDGDCASAVNERAFNAAMNTAANFVSLGPFGMSPILKRELLVRPSVRSGRWNGSQLSLLAAGL